MTIAILRKQNTGLVMLEVRAVVHMGRTLVHALGLVKAFRRPFRIRFQNVTLLESMPFKET
jgi:hypothetical protein